MVWSSIARAFSEQPPRFVFDGDVEPEVRRLIKEAEDFLILVSPYNDFWINLKDELRDTIGRKVSVTIVCRVGENDKDVKWLEQEGADVLPIERLHSKLYMNESVALVTSMNLVESSAKNSKEIGVRFDASESEHEELRGYVEKLIGRSRPTRKRPASPPPRATRVNPPTHRGGYCIRCGIGIAYDIENPFCEKDAATWSSYGNEEYGENYCHAVKHPYPTSKKRPVCPTHYRRRRS